MVGSYGNYSLTELFASDVSLLSESFLSGNIVSALKLTNELDNEEASVIRAWCLLGDARAEETEVFFNGAIKCFPDSLSINLVYSFWSFLNGDVDTSEKYAKNAISIDGSCGGAFALIHMILFVKNVKCQGDYRPESYNYSVFDELIDFYFSLLKMSDRDAVFSSIKKLEDRPCSIFLIPFMLNISEASGERDLIDICLNYVCKRVDVFQSKPVLKKAFDLSVGIESWIMASVTGGALYSLFYKDSSIDFLCRLGDVFNLSSNFKNAEAIFNRVLELDSKRPEPYIFFGRFFESKGYHSKSVGVYKTAIAQGVSDPKIWTGLVTSLDSMGEYSAASKALDISLRNFPLNSGFISRRAYFLYNEGDYEGAFNLFVGLSKILPPDRALPMISCQAASAAREIKVAGEWINKSSTGLDNVKDGKFLGKTLGSQFKVSDNIVSLYNFGRSGSLFLHSLLDGHPEISTLPGVYFKGWFGLDSWEAITSSGQNWREQLVKNFELKYDVLFDAKSSKPIPGTPFGKSNINGIECGFDRMGENRDIVLGLDRSRLSEALLKRLSMMVEPPSSRQFFLLLHSAFDEVLGRDGAKKAVFYHIHNPDIEEVFNYQANFKKQRSLIIVRNPLQSLLSWMKRRLKPCEYFNSARSSSQFESEFLHAYINLTDAVFSILKLLNSATFSTFGATVVRLEDLKSKPEKELSDLCSWIGVDYNESLLSSSFQGIPYWGPPSPSNPNLKGFDRRGLDFYDETVLDMDDQFVFEVLFSGLNKSLGYPSIELSKNSFSDAIKALDKPMLFERNLACELPNGIEDLKKMDLYHLFRKRLCSELNNIERYGDFPAKLTLLSNS